MVDAKPKPANKLVVLENSTLESMARDPAILRELPFLKSLNRLRQAGCGTCGGNQNNKAAANTFMAAKQQIANLPAAKKLFLKQRFNTSGMRVVFRGPAGQNIQLTF